MINIEMLYFQIRVYEQILMMGENVVFESVICEVLSFIIKCFVFFNVLNVKLFTAIDV